MYDGCSKQSLKELTTAAQVSSQGSNLKFTREGGRKKKKEKESWNLPDKTQL